MAAMVPSTLAAVDLQDIIATRSRVEGDLLLVDDFLNHRVDPVIMAQVGRDLAAAYEPAHPDLILTAEASGIPPAMACAAILHIPIVYAKKYLGTGNRYSFSREVTSPTKGTEYLVEVARRVLEPGMRVLIIDDFLAGGRTAEALGEITEEAGCEIVGFGFVIEKSYMEGRDRLSRHGWHTHSLVRVASLEGGRLEFETSPV
jgi:xanthine phosphoribosyltransferase